MTLAKPAARKRGSGSVTLASQVVRTLPAMPSAASAAAAASPSVDVTTLAVFQRCPAERLAAIDPPPEEFGVEPGESIVREGHLDHEWYVVLEGEGAVSTRGEVLGVLGPGEHFGEIAILSREPRRFTVRAQTPMRVLMLTEQAFLDLLEDCGPFGHTLLVSLTRRMSALARNASTDQLQRTAPFNGHTDGADGAGDGAHGRPADMAGPHPSAATHLG